MTKIIGRDQEKKLLQTALDSSNPELIAIYGRRRVGKTYLIREFFKEKGLFFELTGVLEGRLSEQLWNFSQILSKTFQLKQRLTPPKNWREAFDILLDKIESVPEKQKVILFFDELPWLATRRSDLIRSLEYLWNRHLSNRKNIIVVLCGSATSWMINKIIHNRGGLYGRLTQKIHLKPFSLFEAEKYLKAKNISLDRKQLIEIYMVTGGVAKYLDHLEKGLPSIQLIQNLCLSPNGFLATEFYPLFSSLFDHSEKHLAIIKSIAKSHKGLTLSEIVNTTSSKISGHLTSVLKDLESCGFIQFIPFFGKKKREGLYRLIDEYSLFYLNWVETKESPLKFHRSPQFLSWAGYAFENICIKHIEQIIDSLKLSVVVKNISYWQKKKDELPGAQIDLIIDRTDQCINLLEIKFCEGPFVTKKEYAQLLNQRRAIFAQTTQSKKAIFNTLVSPFGAVKNPPYLSSIDQELTMESLFSF